MTADEAIQQAQAYLAEGGAGGAFDFSTAQPDFDFSSAQPVDHGTIGAPQAPTARTFFPASAGLQQASRIHPVISNLPWMRAGAASLDVLRNIGAAVNTPLEMARVAADGGGFHPIQSYVRELRGGRLEPTKEQQGMKDLTNLGVGMIPFGRLAQTGSRAVTSAVESIPMRRPPIDTVQEILRTPEARLPKLSQKQRQVFFSERGRMIREQFGAQQQALKEQQVALRRELGRSANQRSVYIKDQLPGLYANQSRHYRALVDRELAPVANDLIPDQELRSFLMQRFAKNPERLNAVSQKLGLVNEFAPVDPALPPPSFKVGELYQKALDFGTELPRSVRESLRVYTPADGITDDAIDTLVEFLGTKGVDLKEARGFWRGWAPIRNQATQEFRPFLEPDVRLGGGSNRLIQQARGIDPNNAVYADTLAKLLGIDDLPGPVKHVVAKLETTKKELLASRLAQAQASGELRTLQNRVALIADKSQRKWAMAQEITKWLIPASVVAGAGAIANAVRQ